MAEDASSDKDRAKAIRQIRNNERKNRAFQSLKFQRQKHNQPMILNRLEVPQTWPTMDVYDESQEYELEDPKKVDIDNRSLWWEVNCPREIEFLLALRNQRHFGQAETEGTSFTTEDMKSKLNWDATTKEAELVLEGEYEDAELSEISRMFMDSMTRTTEWVV